jgi:flagellar hook-associated protein 2
MATSISSDLNAALKNLAPTFQTAINASIEAESEPLKRIQALKDQTDIRRNIYTDMKTNLGALQTAVQALITTQASYSMNPVLKASIVPGTTGTSVITTSSNSGTMVAGDYDIAVTRLAKAQSRATAASVSPDIALGKGGTFWLGGTGTASITNFTPDTSVNATSITDVVSGQRELGTGSYTVQVRDYEGTRQFRLVNADGTAVSIRSKDGTSYTAGWQSISDGSYDTGRGLTLSLSASGAVGSTSLTYNARGTSITISPSDTQRNIANAINAAVQPEGRDFKASIVAGQLVLNAAQTGANHTMVYSDGAGLGFGATVGGVFTLGADLQAAQNAEFTINGMSVSRSSNSNMSDLIDGVTLNLAGDAEGKSARLTIAGNNDKSVTSMNSLVSTFNAALTHLTGKLTATAKTGTDGKTTYTRGPLTGDTVFRSLRSDMITQINANSLNSGSFKNLADIGLTFDKDLKLTLDSSKFSEALKNHSTDVAALLDVAMDKFNTTLSQHTGSTGSLQSSLTSMEGQLKTYEQRITKHNEALNTRKKSLIDQYTQMQDMLANMGRDAQFLNLTLGTTIDFSS